MTVIDERAAMLEEELNLISGGVSCLSKEQLQQLRRKLWEKRKPGLGGIYVKPITLPLVRK